MGSGVLRQWIAATAALLCVIASVTCLGWVTPILVHLLGPDSEVVMTESQSSWMISVIDIGNLVSPIPAGILGDKWGRKPCILATGPLYFICWMIVLTTNTVEALYVVRILQGTTMGFMFTLVPIYLSEICSPNIRGSIASLFTTAFYFAYLFEFCVGPFLSYRMFTAVTATWPVLQTLLFFWQPESPYYLLMSGRNEEAAKSLSTLRMLPATDQIVLDELEEIKSSLKNNDGNSWISLIKSPSNRKHLFVVCFVSFVTYMTGGYALMSYSSFLFSSMQLSFIEPSNITIILGAFLFVASFFPSVLMDRLGRRPLLLLSTIGSTIFLSLTTIFFYLQDAQPETQYSYIIIFTIFIYYIFWAFGLLPIYVIYQSELFESSVRGNASSVIASVVTVIAFINLKSFSPIVEGFGYCVLFGLYAVISFFGTIGVYLLAPETKGKSLSEIQRDLKE